MIKNVARDGIFKLVSGPGIDSNDSIPPANVARARIWKPLKQPRNRLPALRNRFLGMDSGSDGQVRNPIPSAHRLF
jgi:hypothetical protein